jgi:chromosome partitioning protein
MHIIVTASQKGGAGKTTLAAHLAVAAEAAGHGPVVLVDTDPQGTLTKWWERRKSEIPRLVAVDAGVLPAKIDQLRAQGFALVVIDTPPAITASIQAVIGCSDLVIMPVRPSPADLWAVGATTDMAVEQGREFIFVVSAATRGASITTQACTALSKHGTVATVIHNRVSFAGAFASGQVVAEIEPRGQAAAEVVELLSVVMERLTASTPARKAARKKPRLHAVGAS